MLGKKETVQKTFRLDSKINDNFEILSEVLERTQNDLANVAIQNLLEENEIWLAHNIFVDYAFDYFNNGCETHFTIDNVSVDIKIDENTYETILKIIVKNENGKIVDSFKNKYEDTIKSKEEIKGLLREKFYSIDINCEEVKNYLKNINNYK